MNMDVTTSVLRQPVATPELMHGNQVDGQEDPTTDDSDDDVDDGDDVSDTNTTNHGGHGPDGAVGAVVAAMESILETFVDSLAACQGLSITLSRRASHRRTSETRLEPVRFPGRTVQEARKFSTTSLQRLNFALTNSRQQGFSSFFSCLMMHWSRGPYSPSGGSRLTRSNLYAMC